MIEDDIYTALSGYAGLTNLVSTRMYPVKIPQSPDYPLLTYFRVSNNHINNLSGSSNLNQSRYQFDVYAATYVSANNVADQLINAMAAASFQSILLSRIDIDFDDSTDKFRVSLDFSVWHS